MLMIGIHDLIISVRVDRVIVADQLRNEVLPLELAIGTARHCPTKPLSSYSDMDNAYLPAYVPFTLCFVSISW
jgi:hypothetical protein